MFHVEHNEFGVYIHVPFCISKCGYCDFCRVTDLSLVEGYISALRREVERATTRGGSPRTVYVGGGTPSSVGVGQLDALLSILSENYDLSRVEEFTVECNPDDVSAELVTMMRRRGVNRVSMGAQSLNDMMLRFMGRRHDARQVRDAIATLRSGGIDNISVDMIYGLPEVEGYDFRQDLDAFLGLGVPHLSAYALQYEEGSRFMRMLDDGRLTPTSDDDVAAQNEELCQAMASAGYLHYELSNFAQTGREARHNSSYWDRTPYEGFGPGASSFIGGVRRNNTTDVSDYVAELTQGRPVPQTVENLTPVEVAEETVMLRLRTSVGLDPEEVCEPFRSRLLAALESEAAVGNVEKTNHRRLRIPESRWFVSNDIVSRIFGALG